METSKLKSLIIQYKDIQAEEEDFCQRRRDSKGEFEGLDYNESFNRWYELSRPLQIKKQSVANEIKSLGVGVLVKEPNKVVGARIEKTQFNVRVFSCNTLDKIVLKHLDLKVVALQGSKTQAQFNSKSFSCRILWRKRL